MTITIKDEQGIQGMRLAGRLASEVLDFLTPHVQAGVTTNALDKLAHDYITEVQQAIPAPLNYAPNGYNPYPKSICTSINHQVCHGIPNEKALKKGDIVNIDITVIKDGFHGDTSAMFYVGDVVPSSERLCTVTQECMYLGIAQIKPGAHLGDIGYAIEQHATKNYYTVVQEYCGHGIGDVFHEEPQVLHYGTRGTGMVIKEGMIFTVEPMINAGKRDIRTMPDQWTVKTKDRSLSAQWEHTCLVTPTGVEVLTYSAGSPPPPACVSNLKFRP